MPSTDLTNESGVLESVERDNELEDLFDETVVGNFHNMEIKQEEHRTPNKYNQKRFHHTEKNPKMCMREPKIIFRGFLIKLKADFSSGREWRDTVQVLKEINCSPKTLHPEKFSFIFEGEIKPSKTSRN